MLPSCSTSADRVALLCRPSPKLGELAARGEVIHENRDENHDGATEERGHGAKSGAGRSREPDGAGALAGGVWQSSDTHPAGRTKPRTSVPGCACGRRDDARTQADAGRHTAPRYCTGSEHSERADGRPPRPDTRPPRHQPASAPWRLLRHPRRWTTLRRRPRR